MKQLMAVFSLIALAGCESPKTAEGCKVMLTEVGQAYTRACQQAYHEEMARQRGGSVTRCIDGPVGLSCTIY